MESDLEHPDERPDDAARGEGALSYAGAGGHVTKTFGPASNTINSICAPTETETTATKLKWRLQCRGQLDIDVSGDFNFDSPTHYTATVISKGSMAGALVSDVTTELVGEHVGECQQ